MITALLISTLYVFLLFGLAKFFGIKYTDLTKSTKNIKKGLVYSIGIATILLTLFAVIFGWLPDIFTFSPRVEQLWLWAIPLLYVVGILIRFSHAAWKEFDIRGIIYLIIGTAFVGFSEELLVRGIVVSSLLDNGYSILITAILSSLIFGVLHFINYFNGQSFKLTALQVVTTIISGLSFFIMFAISGTLWLPIVMHFLYDFSLLIQGGGVNKVTGKENKLETPLVLLIYVISLVALFFI